MNAALGPRRIRLEEWGARHAQLCADGLREPGYGGPLQRHLDEGANRRLAALFFDTSAAALRLWNFLLTENDRLREAREEGKKLVGVMKDLGTVPVIAYSDPGVTAFYLDGAWWLPCLLESSAGLLDQAEALGAGPGLCPVRALLGAFVTGAHFPIPDRVVCSVGACCDDLTAISQLLEGLGHPVHWWEIPHRRQPGPDEEAVPLPGGFTAPASQLRLVRAELDGVRKLIEGLTGRPLADATLQAGIAGANHVRALLDELRSLVYTAPACPFPALEMLICEMLAIHFCSDPAECLAVLETVAAEVRHRVAARAGVLPADAVRVFWINPAADLKAMNLLEECGGRLCGSEFLFCHALDPIPEDSDPLTALARSALADPMAGPCAGRGDRICRDITRFGAEAAVISRIPGASHCAAESILLQQAITARHAIPVLEIEVPSLDDAAEAALRTRLEALVETAREARPRSATPAP